MVEAQGFRVRGRVVHVTNGDSVPLGGQWAVLHAVSAAGGAPADSQRTDRRGRYVLRPVSVDTTANYLVSVQYDGIAYFAEPIRASGTSAHRAEPLFVYDTSSTAPAIALAERHLIIRAPESDGTRRVIELLTLVNRGTLTRISPDTSQPVWQGAILNPASRFEVGASDVSAQAIYRRGAVMTVAAPVPPGERQILVSYFVPASIRVLTIPIDQNVGRLSLLVEDTLATLVDPTLVPGGREGLEGSVFVRFGRDSVAAGTPVAVRFSTVPTSVTDWWWVVVALVALTLTGTLVWWWRSSAGFESDDPQTLAAQIAALDAAFDGRETDAYRRRRAEWKRRLTDALARRGESR